MKHQHIPETPELEEKGATEAKIERLSKKGIEIVKKPNVVKGLLNRVVFLNHSLQTTLRFHNPAERKINKSLSSSI